MRVRIIRASELIEDIRYITMYIAAVGGRITPDETMHFKEMLRKPGWQEQVYITTYIADILIYES